MIIDSHTPQSESNTSKNKVNTFNNVDTSLFNNRAYTTYLPNAIIGLSTFYILILCTKFFLKQRRRYIERLHRKEKQRLREKWESSLNQDNSTICNHEKSIERPKTIYNKNHSYPHSSLNLNYTLSSLQGDSSVTVAIPTSSLELSHPNPSDSTLTDIKQYGEKYITRNDLFKDSYYWKIRKNKRLDLLWQWSVSMGYCQYNYGKKLEDRIAELQSKQSIYYKSSLA